jgi:hypothetical protein
VELGTKRYLCFNVVHVTDVQFRRSGTSDSSWVPNPTQISFYKEILREMASSS